MVQITTDGQYKNLYLTPRLTKSGIQAPGMKHDETATLTLLKVWEPKHGVSAPNKGGKPWTMHSYQVQVGNEEGSFAVFDSDAETLAFMQSLGIGEVFTVHMAKEQYMATKGPNAGKEMIGNKLTFKKVE